MLRPFAFLLWCAGPPAMLLVEGISGAYVIVTGVVLSTSFLAVHFGFRWSNWTPLFVLLTLIIWIAAGISPYVAAF